MRFCATVQLRANAEEVSARLEAAAAEKAELAAKLEAADEARRRSRDTIKPLVHNLTLQRRAGPFRCSGCGDTVGSARRMSAVLLLQGLIEDMLRAS